jgi:hypothetical protein
MFASSKSKIALSLAAVTFGLGFAAATTLASAKTFRAGSGEIPHGTGYLTPGGRQGALVPGTVLNASGELHEVGGNGPVVAPSQPGGGGHHHAGFGGWGDGGFESDSSYDSCIGYRPRYDAYGNYRGRRAINVCGWRRPLAEEGF